MSDITQSFTEQEQIDALSLAMWLVQDEQAATEKPDLRNLAKVYLATVRQVSVLHDPRKGAE